MQLLVLPGAKLYERILENSGINRQKKIFDLGESPGYPPGSSDPPGQTGGPHAPNPIRGSGGLIVLGPEDPSGGWGEGATTVTPAHISLKKGCFGSERPWGVSVPSPRGQLVPRWDLGVLLGGPPPDLGKKNAGGKSISHLWDNAPAAKCGAMLQR